MGDILLADVHCYCCEKLVRRIDVWSARATVGCFCGRECAEGDARRGLFPDSTPEDDELPIFDPVADCVPGVKVEVTYSQKIPMPKDAPEPVLLSERAQSIYDELVSNAAKQHAMILPAGVDVEYVVPSEDEVRSILLDVLNFEGFVPDVEPYMRAVDEIPELLLERARTGHSIWIEKLGVTLGIFSRCGALKMGGQTKKALERLAGILLERRKPPRFVVGVDPGRGDHNWADASVDTIIEEMVSVNFDGCNDRLDMRAVWGDVRFPASMVKIQHEERKERIEAMIQRTNPGSSIGEKLTSAQANELDTSVVNEAWRTHVKSHPKEIQAFKACQKFLPDFTIDNADNIQNMLVPQHIMASWIDPKRPYTRVRFATMYNWEKAPAWNLRNACEEILRSSCAIAIVESQLNLEVVRSISSSPFEPEVERNHRGMIERLDQLEKLAGEAKWWREEFMKRLVPNSIQPKPGQALLAQRLRIVYEDAYLASVSRAAADSAKANRLGDRIGTVESENTQLLVENARLRRTLEDLERKTKSRK